MEFQNDFETLIASSVDEVGTEAWDALSASQPFQSARWYRFGEAVLAGCPPTYIVLSQGGKPVARATFWLKHREWLPITSPVVRFVVERLLQRSPLMMCAAPLACVPGLILPTLSFKAEALKTIAETALELGMKENASFAFFSYIKESEVQQASWPKSFSAISFSDAETSLEITWPDFESYLQHLAKSTRRNYKLHCKQAAEMGVAIAAQPTVPDIERAVTLIQNVERYHHVGYRPWTRAILENANLVDFTWITARIEDHIVGCCAVIGDGDAQIATLLGLDYSVPQFIYIYYQIMYAAIRYAVERGARVLFGGGGAYEFKRRLGFRMLPDDYLVVAATKKSFRWLLLGLTRWMGLQTAGVKSLDNSDDMNQASAETIL